MKHSIHTNEDSFRLLLQRELINRCQKSPGYSLRAFARSLKVAPSALSGMLGGKRPITAKSVQKLGLNLGLGLDEIRNFSEPVKRPRSVSKLKFNQVTLDTFAVISDWYHYAILELMAVKGFKSDARWMAATLGLTVQEIHAAVERLERLKLIEKTQTGWRDISGGYTTNIDGSLTSAGARKLQKQILKQALVAIDEVDPGRRNHTSMTMAVDVSRLSEAVKLTAEYRRQICALLEEGGEKTEVYHLSIALFPITDLKNNTVGGKK